MKKLLTAILGISLLITLSVRTEAGIFGWFKKEKVEKKTEKKVEKKLGEPQYGGTLIFARGGDSVKLDPIDITDGESMKATINIFDTLVAYEDGGTATKPSLAESWTVSDDELNWTFKIRKNVKFHDGTDLNAEAIKFNIDRWRDKENKYHTGNFNYWGWMFGGFPGIVKDVVVIDDYTIKMVLTKKSAPFIANLAMVPFGISSPTAIKEYGEDYFKHPVGTGPYKLKSWKMGDKIVMERNDNYWNGKPYLETVILRAIPDNTARFMELQTGTIDMMDGLTPNSVPLLKKSKSLKISLRPSMNVGYLAMNMDKEPFTDVKVRRAVNYAVNKKAIIEALYAGMAQEAKNPLPPSLWGYNDSITPYEYNPEKAKKLLAEAGLENGFETKLWAMPVPRPYMPQPKLIAQAIQSDLAKVGIKAEIVTYDWGTYLEKTENGEHDMAFLGWTGDNGDPDNFIYVLLDKDNTEKGSAGNIAFYKSDILHEKLIEAQVTSDIKVRTKLYEEAQEIIHNDAPWLPLAHSTPPIALKSIVHGYIPSPLGVEKLNNVWKEK